MRESSRPRLADQLIWGTVALGFFGPFEMMKRDNGLFVPSSEWVLLSTLAYVATLLVLGGAVVALYWHLIERSRDRMSKQRVMFSRIAAAGVLCLLPIWTIGLVHGIYRSILMVAPQDRASMPVQFDHVSVHEYPGHKTYKAVVRLPALAGRSASRSGQ